MAGRPKKESTIDTVSTTPLMRQYFQFKAKHPDAILLFRVGDFYETFGDDAKITSETLGIVLTSRNNGGSDIALAGFPHHSMDLYLPKLIRAGYRVAICEQLEKPSKEKKIVKRGVTEVVTPGVAVDDPLLDHRSNNYLAAVHLIHPRHIGIAFLDLSTGSFMVSEGPHNYIDKLLQSFQPSEVIMARNKKEEFQQLFGDGFYVYGIDDWVFTLEFTRERLLDQFGVQSLKGFGIEEMVHAQVASGAVLQYLASTENNRLGHLGHIQRIPPEDYVWLDRFTIRNLELIQPQHEGGASLLKVLDRTHTPMGARLLKHWVVLPLLSTEKIRQRQSVVSYFVTEPQQADRLEPYMKQLGDLERIVAKVTMGRISPREVVALKKSLKLFPKIKELLHEVNLPALQILLDIINPCKSLTDLIDNQLEEDPPAVVAKGGVIKSGFNPELDDLRHVIRNAKELLLGIQREEIKRTGITNLKVGFNNVFGYYLEVTNKYKNQGLVPDDWVRKQTLTGSERYITDELKQLEHKILTAEEKILALEEQLFNQLVEAMQQYINPIQQNAQAAAELDVLLSFATIARQHRYIRPEIDDSTVLDITSGRHPVIEQHLALGEKYVPNDVNLSSDEHQILMITGPNMSGKSALLRQTALIVLMAQMGSFVPAESARIGLVDKIFTRVGASDNISSGESTFMVEMNETASILNNLSSRSLILLDEIGRGTSTYDGISIAWSIAEFLHEHPSARPKTLFATHYHELNELAKTHERIHNFNVSVKETGNKVIFLRKLEPGGAHHSFGIHVAQMAGMPKEVVLRAQHILHQLESKAIQTSDDTKAKIADRQPDLSSMQLNLFSYDDKQLSRLKEAIEQLDLNSMTPIESMLKLNELKSMLNED
jgi:DNA mismatch repair protein MutS